MHIRDRVKELRRVRASELRPNPRNWRTHPDKQRDALRGLLAEVGYADALLVREADDGVLELIDGHLRAETTPTAIVPVLVLDVSAEEADKILLTHDPVSAMAGRDDTLYRELWAECDTQSDAVKSMLADVAGPNSTELPSLDDRPEVDVPECYQVVIECHDEAEQERLFERMRGEGYKCRLLML